MTTPDRADAAAALLASIRDLMAVVDRMQAAASWVLAAFGDELDAETVRMLRIPGGSARPGRPPVPPAVSREYDERQQSGSIDLGGPRSVTVTDPGLTSEDGDL